MRKEEKARLRKREVSQRKNGNEDGLTPIRLLNGSKEPPPVLGCTQIL